MKKYEFTGATKTEMYDGKEIALKQIRAMRDITQHGITSGTLGGWLSGDATLSQEGDSWVSGHSHIYGESEIAGNVFIDQSNVYESFIDGNGKIKSSHIFSSVFKKTEFQKVDGCVLNDIDCIISTLNLTESLIRNLKVVRSRLEFRESEVFSYGSVPLVVMLKGKTFSVNDSNIYINTEHPDHARIHEKTVMNHVDVDNQRPLTMFAAFESIEWENLSLANVQFHFGDIKPSIKPGKSVLLGIEKTNLKIEDLYLQCQDSVIHGEVNIQGEIGLRDTTIRDHASVINRGNGMLYLANVKMQEMASIDKRMEKFIKLENSVYGADDILCLN